VGSAGGTGVSQILPPIAGTSVASPLPQPTLQRPANAAVKFGPEARSAQLYTEFTIGGARHVIVAYGARSCQPTNVGFAEAQGTEVYSLECDLTYFGIDDSPLGPIRIFQDPRIANLGWIYLRRDQNNNYVFPALSYFNQHLIFHIGGRYFYYPRAWQVVSAITQWPPEYNQYHHLEKDTPVFDLITRQPNVARKGVSTISINGPLAPDEETRIRSIVADEIQAFNNLPASKMSPENLTFA
jgi:hypothetical protein